MVTCCLYEADALFDEDRDGPLRTDHGGQWHPKVGALNGLGDGVSGFGPWFLRENRNEGFNLKVQCEEYRLIFIHTYIHRYIHEHTHI